MNEYGDARDKTYECDWCGWEGSSDELAPLGKWTKEGVEEEIGRPFEERPEPFHECPECGEPTPRSN